MGRWYNKKLISGLFFSAIMTSFSHGAEISLDFIGQRVIPHDHKFQGTTVGGLSSLDYNAATDSYSAICDDRSHKNPARFYRLKLDYDKAVFHGWRITDVQFIRRPDGTVFPKPQFFPAKAWVDPEAMRISPEGKSYFWASEGHAQYGVNPFVREMSLDGRHIRQFTLPEKYIMGQGKGIRDNKAFEALAVSHDQKSILLATESPLIQDGPEADADHGAPVRLLQFDIETGKAIHEYVYPLDPVHKNPLPLDKFSVNGVVDILALGRQTYIVVERSFAVGAGLSVRLYLMDLAAATDVLSLESLEGAGYQSVTKKLLLDLGVLGIPIDNIEGISFGKTLKDGRRSLVMVSDDNFRAAQVTQILVFAVNGPTLIVHRP